MNWTGGSRNRLVMKNDAKKQKEFFEKRKLQRKLKNLGLALPTSPGGTAAGSGSMDLVTLFIVNQIAAKKENKDVPKVAVLGGSRRGSHKQNHPLVLPMSPCSPSKLSLVESQPLSQCSFRGMRKKSSLIPQGFKCRQLSPVMESAFSDNSASDYRPNLADALSPFSVSSNSSVQGIFPLNLNPDQQPPPTFGLEKTKFEPFSQPRGMMDNMSWSCGSNHPLYQLETPTAAQVLFGSPQQDPTIMKGLVQHEISFSLNGPEEEEPVMDFTQSEQQFEEDVFRGFSHVDNDTDAFYFGGSKSKIYLKEETPVKSSAPQTVPEPQCTVMEFSSCIHSNFAGHNPDSITDCGYSPNSSCPGCCLSSDIDDEEESCPPCLHLSAPTAAGRACGVDVGETPGKEIGSQPRLHTPLTKPKTSKKTDEKSAHLDQSPGSCSHEDSTAWVASPPLPLPPPALNPEICKCQKTPRETQDAGTQTAAETSDASTQCLFVSDCSSRPPVLSVNPPPVALSVHHPATGRQCNTTAERNPTGRGGKKTPMSTWKSKTPSQPGYDSVSKTFLKFPVSCLRGEENGEERRGQVTSPVIPEHMMEEVLSAAVAKRPPEEVGALQEIADILLLLKGRKD